MDSRLPAELQTRVFEVRNVIGSASVNDNCTNNSKDCSNSSNYGCTNFSFCGNTINTYTCKQVPTPGAVCSDTL